MKTSYLIALVALFLCSVPICAEQVVVSQSSSKIAAAIPLQKTMPSIVMWNLGLFRFDSDAKLWQKDQQSKSSPVMVDVLGVDMLVPCDKERVLLVYGTKAAVERLKSVVSKLDVTPRQLQIKAEVVSIDTEAAKQLGINDKTISALSKSDTEEIRTSLREHGAEWINSPVLNTVANVPAEISVKSDSSSFQMKVLPRINADGSVTLTTRLSLSETNSQRAQSLFTQRRMADGESVLMGGFIDSSDSPKELFVLLTPKVID